ncbi:MAG TPA: hypothetical protein VGJ80_00305 [Gemmatimonadales bacterium]|jgi:hypothetical protein
MGLVTRALAALFVCWIVTAPAAAQLSARADVSSGGRYVWHGVSRAAGLVAQPSLAAGVRHRGFSLESGAVLHYELDRASAGELSETGAGERLLGEADFWGRASLVVGPTRLDAGVVRYSFRGDSTRGGLGRARNTTEVYAALSATSAVNASLEAWLDVERVRGAFLRASLDLPVLGWPFPPFAFGFVEGDVGLNVGQGPNPARAGELANFAGRGITHVGLGMGAEVRTGRLSRIGWTTLGVGLRSQLNLDDATRFNGAGRNRDFSAWLWTGFTIVLGSDAQSRQ